jgi:hypothetical protein
MKEGLAGVDITDTGDEALVQETHFDGLGGAFELGGKLGWLQMAAEGFRTKSLQWPRIECEASEASNVLENESVFGKLDVKGGVFWQGLIERLEEHPSGHPEVADQTENLGWIGTIEVEDDELGATSEAGDGRSD